MAYADKVLRWRKVGTLADDADKRRESILYFIAPERLQRSLEQVIRVTGTVDQIHLR